MLWAQGSDPPGGFSSKLCWGKFGCVLLKACFFSRFDVFSVKVSSVVDLGINCAISAQRPNWMTDLFG